MNSPSPSPSRRSRPSRPAAAMAAVVEAAEAAEAAWRRLTPRRGRRLEHPAARSRSTPVADATPPASDPEPPRARPACVPVRRLDRARRRPCRGRRDRRRDRRAGRRRRRTCCCCCSCRSSSRPGSSRSSAGCGTVCPRSRPHDPGGLCRVLRGRRGLALLVLPAAITQAWQEVAAAAEIPRSGPGMGGGPQADALSDAATALVRAADRTLRRPAADRSRGRPPDRPDARRGHRVARDDARPRVLLAGRSRPAAALRPRLPAAGAAAPACRDGWNEVETRWACGSAASSR